ncbi:B12-binding domain-containing radical SAM protein [Pseudomonas quasicaspiana]|uniref:B12-binding domain-containing radical SAM protein n=1 Tax=Pseudomonas quasicaspiana TaxID=2829821 RepID=UPI001E4E29BE|nr:radical SAM protein [Pseudomonas quasicaspiana]MCD5974925.1 cobalamin-dependent protein [Pseudomonas quasicaspiana]
MNKVKSVSSLHHNPSQTTESARIKLALVALPYGEGPQKVMPLGLQNISAYLNKKNPNVDVRIFDYSELKLVDTSSLSGLISWDPKMVGFSVYSSNVIAAKQWAEKVKGYLPNIFIFCGGPHISLAAEAFLRYAGETYHVALVGEGEYSTLLLTEEFTRKQAQDLSNQSTRGHFNKLNFEAVPNAVWLDDYGECLTSHKCKNQLPAHEWENPLLDYATSDIQGLYYTDRRDGVRRKAIAFTSSRGCPLACSFCAIIAADKDGPKWRAADASTLLKWLEEAAETYSFEHVYMMDANFFVRKDRVLEFSDGLYRLFKGRVTWSSSSTVGYLLKVQDALPTLVNQGLRLVELGIESGSQSQLDYMNKKVTVEKNISAVRALQENGIALGPDFIMFYHDQTPREILENLLFILHAGLTEHESLDHYFNIMMLYPGTPVRATLEQRLGYTLPLYELPNSRHFIQNHEVSLIYNSFIDRFAKHHLTRLEAAISKNLLKIRSGTDDYTRAYYSLLNVYLLHLPFKILWSLSRNPRAADQDLVSSDYRYLIAMSLDEEREPALIDTTHSHVTTGSGGRRGELIARTR